MTGATWAPLLVGTLAVLGVAAVLTYEDPSPGDLVRSHGQVTELQRLQGCDTCHTRSGLDAGCLGCHDEIAKQRAGGRGFHAGQEGQCAECHPEHNGKGFALMEGVAWKDANREEFRHEGLDFQLHGAHEMLSCGACHEKGRFALASHADFGRKKTYLGLGQTCRTCHEDVHKGGRSTEDCAHCHGQEHFRPADLFDHTPFFPLTGGHAGGACNGCHVLPEGGEPVFSKVKGKTCRECHENPHRTDWGESCEACHRTDDLQWGAGREAVKPEVHARTGFSLAVPHAAVACAGCHADAPTYAERFPEAARAQEDCRSCHEDEHRGQFGARACLDCHERTRFLPATYTRKDHKTFALKDAHAKAECKSCHKAGEQGAPVQFTGTARECASCHEDIHQGQFQGQQCDACHNQTSFLPARYDLAKHTAFPLSGAHVAVACRTCHVVEPEGAARRFQGTPQACKACHEDPHGGQFAKEMRKGDCTTCHAGDAKTFAIRPFDHAKRTSFALDGAHANATCASCHRESKGVVGYRGTPGQCASCHEDAHRGQFEDSRCDRCHLSRDAWKVEPFDHKRTRFPLDGTHAKVACGACHLGAKQPDGSVVTQYRPLGTQCRDCHDFQTR